MTGSANSLREIRARAEAAPGFFEPGSGARALVEQLAADVAELVAALASLAGLAVGESASQGFSEGASSDET